MAKILRKHFNNSITKESEVVQVEEKYRQALEKVLVNLRSIDGPNVADEYIDDSIKIIVEVLKNKNVEDENEFR